MSESIMSRNTALGIAQRTRKNLQFVRRARGHRRERLHLVTQLLTSLLGLVILPWEKIEPFPFDIELHELRKRGWPKWNITLDCPRQEKDKTRTLKQLVYHVRNAASHGRITFDSESRDLRDVTFVIEDAPSKKAPVNWRAEVRGDYLYRFCTLFTKALEDSLI